MYDKPTLMDRYYTVMLIPEREKKVKSFRIPWMLFHGMLFLGVVLVILLGILSYDYWKILQQVYENKHLSRENRQFKEQIQLFQVKINTLIEDLERIHIFEKKLRIITGIDNSDTTRPLFPNPKSDPVPEEPDDSTPPKTSSLPSNGQNIAAGKKVFRTLDELKNYTKNPDYLELKKLYEQKIASNFGMQTGHSYTKEWSNLIKRSFALAEQFASFDYKFNIIKSFTKRLELDVHRLDQYLLDKDSLLASTPTLLPTKGWITSYYGPRISPTSKRMRMHEGLDIGAKPGTPIISPADGRILYAGIKPGFGKFVQIDHGYGLETFYAHNKRLFVKKGDIVKRGRKIASIGSTGSSTGPHLHYEIRVNGTPIDPLYYILD